MTLTVRVIAPDKTVWDNEAQEVILPSGTGLIGILTNHAPLLTTLDIGVMQVRVEKEWETIALMGGFAEVEDNEVKVLVNGAQLGKNIDVELARSQYEEAQKNFDKATEANDVRGKLKANLALKKARAIVQAAGGL